LILYRASNHADLAGKGGEVADGRWHTRRQGRRIVYVSDHPALCLLESLVHVEREQDLPNSYQLLSVDVPDRLIETLDADRLAHDWRTNPRATQEIGNEWLRAGKAGALLVPSVIVPIGRNCLLNPLVAGISDLKPTVVGRFPFDPRLVRPAR
jgi:RES domain-containing protein